MTGIRTAALVGVVTAASSLVLLSVAAAEPATTRQRISMTGIFDTETGRGTWKLIPLTAGPLKQDSGTLTGSGTIGPKLLRNGQRITVIVGGDTLTSKRGGFGVSQRIESTDVGNRYSADIGTWEIRGGVGAYEGVTGKGRAAAVGLPNGKLLVNQEGWVTTP